MELTKLIIFYWYW